MLSADEVLISRFCSVVLAPPLVAELAEAGFDLAIVDLMFNECGLALASHLRIPAVGYWAFSFASGVQVSLEVVIQYGFPLNQLKKLEAAKAAAAAA